ncbi:MAG: phosphotransferase family protein [Rhodospirillales bacterium]|nr:phosphotransferase family protein [Rhodospirillales bacterium]
MDMSLLAKQLDAFVAARYPAGSHVQGLTEADGHAGLTFKFQVTDPATGGVAEELFLKVPPKGVKRKQNTDVYRQAPLLAALKKCGIPVPDVRWAGDDEDWFDVPYIITAKQPGRTLLVWDPHSSYPRTPKVMEPLWRQTAEALVDIHKVDWRTALAGWEDPRPLDVEVNRWDRIYGQAPYPEWITAAKEVHDLLLATMRDGEPVGLIHGDYQPGNVLFENGKLVAILDWELSGIGAHLLDIGWLMMTADPLSWVDTWGPIHPLPIEEIRDIYEAGRGQRFPDIPWYQALAGFRLASIGCLNVKLHQKGQRPDPLWENFIDAIPVMFERAKQLLLEYR